MKYNIRRGTRFPMCPICGKTDYCFVTEDNNGIYYYCGRVHQDKVPGFTAVKKHGSLIRSTAAGDFVAYQSDEQLETWKMEQKEKWLREHGYTLRNSHADSNHSNSKNIAAAINKPVYETPLVEKCKKIPAEKIDEMYRYMFELLHLEPFHRESLLQEWNAGQFKDLGENILKCWPVISLPPPDYARNAEDFSDNISNISRHEVASIMAQKFGDLEGLYGFFKDANGDWDISGVEGILFPCFSATGKIIGIRIKNQYPDYSGEFMGFNGTYFHKYVNGRHVWYFQQKSDDIHTSYKPFVVYDPKTSIELVEMDGDHPVGKAGNKYVIFSSYYGKPEKIEGKTVIKNGYHCGAKSGIKTSVYYKAGDLIQKVIFTEGEKKGIVANAFFSCVVVHIPGVQNYKAVFEPCDEYGGESLVNFLIKNGAREFYIGYDADKYSNKIVMESQNGFISELSKISGISIHTLEWGDAYFRNKKLKGLDDACIFGIVPKIK